MRSSSGGSCLLEIEFVLKRGKRREFSGSFAALHGHEGDGHLRTVVLEDIEEPGHFLWIGEWSDRSSAEKFTRSDGFGILLGAVRVLANLTDCRLIDRGEFKSMMQPSRPVQFGHFERIEIENGF